MYALAVSGLLMMLSAALVLAQPGDLYALPAPTARLVSSSSFVGNSSERLFAAANWLTNTVSIVQPGQSEIVAEIPVGRDPRTVAYTPDDQRVAVVNRGDGTLSVIDINTLAVTNSFPVGVLPYGVVTADNTRAFVALQGADQVALVDLDSGHILERIATPPAPAGLALWGDFLYVTHLWTGQLSLIYLPQMRVVRTISTGTDTGLSQSVTIDPLRGLAYLPQSRLNAQNRLLTFDTTVFPVVNVVNLRSMELVRGSRIALDTADRPVNMPFAAVLDAERRWLFVANAGSNDISVIDLTSNLGVAHIPVGVNPRGLQISRNFGTLWVHNMIDGTITIVDTRASEVSGELPINNLTISADVLLGAELFHSAEDPRVTHNRWLSCASCHFDGLSAGRVWMGYEDGPRNTPLLYDLENRPRLNWSGTWDEIADIDLKIRTLQAGNGLITSTLNPPLGDPHAGLSLEIENLTAYLYTLDGPAAPAPSDPAKAEVGAQVFAALNCASCHSGDTLSDGQLHDVGTGGEFVTPTLRWLWLSEPYLHDGRAATLHDVFVIPGEHQLIRETSLEDIEALVSYLLTLPQATMP